MLKKPTLLLCFFLLLLQVSWAQAHKIYLKNGKVVSADVIIEEDTLVRYEKYGGMIALLRSDIERIEYERQRARAVPPGDTKQDKTERQEPAGHDLVSVLRRVIQPGTPIEEANMATLAVESDLGSGSGFFISARGDIVTNRHVVKVTEGMKAESLAQFNTAKRRLLQAKKSLVAEKNRYLVAKDRYYSNKSEYSRVKKDSGTSSARLQSMHQSLQGDYAHLQRWKNDYETRTKEYKKAKRFVQKAKAKYDSFLRGMQGRRFYKVVLADKTEFDAYLVKVSQNYDLALLRLKGYTTPYLQPRNIVTVSQGATVFAIGNPAGFRNSISSGVYSAKREDHIQTSAEISPGNSGGPLITADGKVIGVNTKKMIGKGYEGIGFALDIDLVFQEFAEFLPKKGE